MKIRFSILLLLVHFHSFCQNEKIRTQISDIFSGFDITQKPSIIEPDAFRAVDYGGTSIPEPNRKRFFSHSLFPGEMDGSYNTTYLYRKDLFDQFGIYKITMEITFKTISDSKKALEKLKKMFKNPDFRTFSEVARGKDPVKEKYIYLIDENLDLPRVVVQYDKPFSINIEVYTSWDFKKFRNYKGKLFDDY